MSDDVSGDAELEVLGESDWEDEDLLSIDEASRRIETEISSVSASLTELSDGPERERVAARLEALERVLRSIQQGPSPLASVSPRSA